MKKKELERRLRLVEEDRLCWVERWSESQTECRLLAGWLMSEWVNVNETKIAEVDELLNKYIGQSDV